jgi:hypothetical protein
MRRETQLKTKIKGYEIQLDLFEGVILTVEQEQMVAKFKEDKNKTC